LDILSEGGMLECRPIDFSMDPNSKLLLDQGELLHNSGRYRTLVDKLNNLTVTRPDIAYTVSVVSQFLSAPRTSHWDAVIRVLGYWKRALGKGFYICIVVIDVSLSFFDANWAGSSTDKRSTIGYCVFVGGNFVS